MFDKSSLQEAALYGETGEILRLLEAGAEIDEPDTTGRAALHNAVWSGHLEAVKILIERGANIDVIRQTTVANLWTPLHFAAENDQSECAGLLIDAGANVNAKDQFGQTPLSLALDEMASPDVAKLLIERGADLGNALDRAGSYVDVEGGLEVVELLRQRGAS